MKKIAFVGKSLPRLRKLPEKKSVKFDKKFMTFKTWYGDTMKFERKRIVTKQKSVKMWGVFISRDMRPNHYRFFGVWNTKKGAMNQKMTAWDIVRPVTVSWEE